MQKDKKNYLHATKTFSSGSISCILGVVLLLVRDRLGKPVQTSKWQMRLEPHIGGLVGAPWQHFPSNVLENWLLLNISTCTTCKISASRSQISFCRCIIKPPRIQTMAWSVSNKFPRTHTAGMSLNSQPYLSLIASLNSLLLRVKFISFNDITLTQLEAPFSFINSTAR